MDQFKKQKWTCLICGGNAYQRYGGTRVPVVQFGEKGKSKESFRTMGTHFMCKGCSVFFSNPRLFNAERTISEK